MPGTYYIIEHPDQGRWVTDGRHHRFSPIVARTHVNVCRFVSLHQAEAAERPLPMGTQIWRYDGLWEKVSKESIRRAYQENVAEERQIRPMSVQEATEVGLAHGVAKKREA